MISVIIPAHNESSVIQRGLTALLDGAAAGELEVIVVANGCTDDTAAKVRAFGHSDVRLIEAAIGSKSNALNLGDVAATCFPRFYVDADVVLTFAHLRRIAAELETGAALAACPGMRMDLTSASWGVRAYYAIWRELPYVREGMMGVGVYALSREGRGRFQQFPAIIADDGYVRLLFGAGERIAVESTYSVVTAPSRVSGLVKIKTRGRLGLYQLKAMFPELYSHDKKGKRYGSALGIIARKPKFWPAAITYFWVNLATRWRARRQLASLDQYKWERDNSSRREDLACQPCELHNHINQAEEDLTC